MMIMKTTALRTPLPMIVAGDGAGEIVEVGRNVSNWSIGNRVTVFPMVAGEGMTGETRLGTCSELHRIPASSVIRIPDGLSYEHAASLPIAYATALRMMKVRTPVGPGQRVVVLGAAGGVGTACVQLAKSDGAEVIACSGSDAKLEKLKELGADHVVNTATTDMRQWVWDTFGKAAHGRRRRPRRELHRRRHLGRLSQVHRTRRSNGALRRHSGIHDSRIAPMHVSSWRSR